MLLSAVSVLVVAQSSSEIPDGLMNNPVYLHDLVWKIYSLRQSIIWDAVWIETISTQIIVSRAIDSTRPYCSLFCVMPVGSKNKKQRIRNTE